MQSQADESTFRSYLFFWTGQLISLLGSSLAQFVIVWWITLETKSPVFLSLASLLGFAPMVILSFVTGVFVDRWSRRALIGVVDFLQAFATLILVLLFWTGNISIWLVLAMLALRGAFQAFHNPAVAAIIPLMVPKARLSRINGLNYLFSGAVTLAGPVIAALLLGLWQIYQILWIDVGTFLIALVPLLLIRIPSVTSHKQEKSSFGRAFLEGFSFIKTARGFISLLLLATALNFLLIPLSTLLPYFVKFDHYGNAADLAFVMAFFQGSILAGGALMTVTKGFKNKMMVVALSVYLIFSGYVLVALTPTGLFWFMAISGTVMAFCVPIANVSIMTTIQTIVPLEMQGRINSVTSALASAATPLGMILSGIIVGFTATSNLFLGCALSGIIMLTLSWFFTDLKHVEKLEQTLVKQ